MRGDERALTPIEVITGSARRRRWSAEEKLRIVEETFTSGETISSVARRNGVAANLLYRWRRLMTEGGTIAVQADEDHCHDARHLPLEPV